MAERREVGTRYFAGTDLIELLDRIVDRGAVITGDVVIGLAGVDLILLDLRLLLISVEGLERTRRQARGWTAAPVNPAGGPAGGARRRP